MIEGRGDERSILKRVTADTIGSIRLIRCGAYDAAAAISNATRTRRSRR
jgi:hypothetical protein